MADKITHIALFSNNEGPIQEAGASAEAAIAAAVATIGGDAKAEDFVAKPVTARFGMFLAAGDCPTRWAELDGVADLCDEDYKPAFFVFSKLGSEDDEGRQLFEKLQDGAAIETETAADAILTVLAGFYDHVGWPGDATYVAIEVPVGTEIGRVFVEIEDDVYRLTEAFAEAVVHEQEVDEEDWDEFLFDRDGVPGEDEDDQVSLINGIRDYDDELRLITDRPVSLNGTPCAVISVYRRQDPTAFAFERKVYPKIRRGQESIGAATLRSVVEAEIERTEMDALEPTY